MDSSYGEKHQKSRFSTLIYETFYFYRKAKKCETFSIQACKFPTQNTKYNKLYHSYVSTGEKGKVLHYQLPLLLSVYI